MKTRIFLFSALIALLVAGCARRSISDSGYHGSGHGRSGQGHNPDYRGELTEFDVLGVQRTNQVTEEEIIRALDRASRVKLRKGGPVMVIQSGAFQPDEAMRAALSRHFSVVPFSGQVERGNNGHYARSLRLAAAQAGCETVMCYWGVLETARRGLETKAVSWVPIAGWVVPDERQAMRIQLKVALVDVRTGNWTMFAPEAFENRALSLRFSRESSDQGQVEKLKRLAYEATATNLVAAYVN